MVATKRTRSKVKRVKRVKRAKRSLKRRSFKNTKKNKRTKRKHINRRTKRKKRTKRERTKRMKGGMDSVEVLPTGGAAGGAGGTAVETPPEGECVKKESKSGLWRKKYVKIEGKSLNVYEPNKSGEPRGSSIPNLTGVSVVAGEEPFGMMRTKYPKLIISNGANMKGGKEQVELAFTHDFQDDLRWTQIMTNLKTAIENISAGRAWNVGAEEQEQRDKVTHLAEVERLAKEDLLNKETQRNDITLRLKNILNEYCTVEGFNIKSIDSFKNGAMGLIITVTLDTGLQRVIKISYDYNGTDINEYTIQEEVNNISSEISPIVYFFQMIKSSDLKEILICIKQLYHLGDLIIPVTWFGILGDFFKPESDNEPRLENVHFSMIMMDYIEGISFYEATGGKKMEEIDGLLEDLRLKINLLHENGIYHCDLHNDNVVVDGNKAKIIDFGWATKDPGGTPQWNEEGKCTIENPPSQVQDTLHMMCGLRAGPDWNGEGSCLLDR